MRTINPWAKLAFYLLMGVAIALLVLGTFQQWDKLASYRFQVNWVSLGTSSLMYGATILVTVWGWHTIMTRIGGCVSYSRNLKLYCSTNLARRLPTAIFYTASRAYIYGRENISATLITMAVGLELIMVAVSGLIVTAIIWPFADVADGLPLSATVLPVAGISALLLTILFTQPPALMKWLKRLSQRLFKASLPTVPRQDILQLTAIYSFNWLLGGTMFFLLVRTFTPVPWSSWPNVVAIWALSGLVSTLVTLFIPAGLGPREVTMAYLLNTIVPPPIALAIAAVSRIWIAVNQFLWFLLSLLM